jgi:3-hydroxyacyl-CoA dehydrogenase
MRDPSRLIVVHPFNPPHILPLLEIVPSPQTSQSVIDHTVGFWRRRGHEPVLLQKEITGFVAGRLAWVLLREAIHLVRPRHCDSGTAR